MMRAGVHALFLIPVLFMARLAGAAPCESALHGHYAIHFQLAAGKKVLVEKRYWIEEGQTSGTDDPPGNGTSLLFEESEPEIALKAGELPSLEALALQSSSEHLSFRGIVASRVISPGRREDLSGHAGIKFYRRHIHHLSQDKLLASFELQGLQYKETTVGPYTFKVWTEWIVRPDEAPALNEIAKP